MAWASIVNLFNKFLTPVIFLVAYCLILRPVLEEGLAPGVEGHGELLHLLTIDLDLQFLVVTPNNPDLTKPDRASRMYWIENSTTYPNTTGEPDAKSNHVTFGDLIT